MQHDSLAKDKFFSRDFFGRLSAVFFAGLFYFLGSNLARAAGSVTIDTSLPGPYSTSTGLGPIAIIGNLYYFALGIGGLLAFGSIVYAGIKWATSQGNPSSISDAKDQITQAALGLLLLLGSYIILNTINPALTVLKIPKLESVQEATEGGGGTPPSGGPASSSTCPIAPLTPIEQFGAQAAAMEGGQKVIWNSDDPAVQANLDIVHAEHDRLQSMASGFSATANSVYRPAGYQKHLAEIVDRSKKLQALSPDALSQCQDVNSAVLAEEQKHAVCRGSAQGICIAASQNSPHTRGVAVDLQLSKITAAALNSFLKANGFRLHLAPIQGDPVHFEI